jgi:hypothetical protein
LPEGIGDEGVGGCPAPLKIGIQMFAQATVMKMIAESKIEGFMRS